LEKNREIGIFRLLPIEFQKTMAEASYLPRIKTAFDAPSENNFHYKEVVQNSLKKVIPSELLVEGVENFQNKFESHLPLMRSTSCTTVPSNISFYLIAKYRPNAFKYFFEMISRWLIPGRRLNVLLVYAADFAFEDISEDIYTLWLRVFLLMKKLL
jgi:hypothetical protein